jgi:hypothetical protein
MKICYLSLFAILFSTQVIYSQNGQVYIEQEPELTHLLSIYKKGNTDPKVYTIQVGFGNFATADKLKSEIELEYPDWPVNLVFDSPTYRVHLGRFHNVLDAEREFLEVRKKYPGAILLRPGTRK